MTIDMMCSSPEHPIVPAVRQWVDRQSEHHAARLVHRKAHLRGGDVLFLVPCTEIIEPALHARFAHSLVLHASDLPEGRGWSPHVWAILNGAETITVTLLDAVDPVDSGAIWAKLKIDIPRDALFEEINRRLFHCEVQLMDKGLEMIAAGASPIAQHGAGATYLPRRTPADSEIDPTRSLAEQFDAIRVADPDRYPAFCRLRGAVYRIKLEKVTDGTDQN